MIRKELMISKPVIPSQLSAERLSQKLLEEPILDIDGLRWFFHVSWHQKPSSSMPKLLDWSASSHLFVEPSVAELVATGTLKRPEDERLIFFLEAFPGFKFSTGPRLDSAQDEELLVQAVRKTFESLKQSLQQISLKDRKLAMLGKHIDKNRQFI